MPPHQQQADLPGSMEGDVKMKTLLPRAGLSSFKTLSIRSEPGGLIVPSGHAILISR